MSKIKTSKKKDTWATARASTLVGRPLKPPAAAAKYYATVLKKAVARMRKDYQTNIERELKPAAKAAAQDSIVPGMGAAFLFLDKKWAGIFSKLSKRLADDVIDKVERASQIDLDGSLKDLSGLAIKTPSLPAGMLEQIQIATRVNVGLIQSVHAQYHERVFNAVMPGLGDAQAMKGAAERLVQKTYHIGETVEMRAGLIARDQTRKLSSAVNTARMKSAGVKQFMWRHSGGSLDPRKLHQSYDGQIFDLDDPPIIDAKTGERGMPGDAINCRCTATPVLTFGDGG